MGMFTSIRHPVTGKEVQIKTGFDDCKWFSVGDKVPWTPNLYYPGSHVDGVHRGYCDHLDDTWVVIKDCTVLAVLDGTDINCAREDIFTYLWDKYSLGPPDPALWPEESWESARQKQQEADERHAQWDKEATEKGLTGASRLGFLMGKVMSGRMNYESVGRKLFTVEPMPESALSFFGDPEKQKKP